MPGLLLRGGTVLLHTAPDQVAAVKTDILIEDGIIRKVEQGISTSSQHEVIDCSDKIISPGFVDTHTHMWETPLKGVCEDMTGLTYFATSKPLTQSCFAANFPSENLLILSTVFTASASVKPEDVFWCSLAGYLESLNAGTTTVLDYDHANWTTQYGMSFFGRGMTTSF